MLPALLRNAEASSGSATAALRAAVEVACHHTASGGSAMALPAPSTCWSKSMMEPVMRPDSSLER
jgi:hypothetical protein